jgi:hypothetical protein
LLARQALFMKWVDGDDGDVSPWSFVRIDELLVRSDQGALSGVALLPGGTLSVSFSGN